MGTIKPNCHGAAWDNLCPLTTRERQIAPLLVAGLQDKEIARRMNRSTSTIAKQIASIRRKMGSENRTAAAVNLRDRGVKASGDVPSVRQVRQI